MPIQYIEGDATVPVGEGPKIIAHVCNDKGLWGRGFVLALSKRWPQPERRYLAWSKERDFGLGGVQLVGVGQDLYVANMVAQHGIYPNRGVPPIRYAALQECLKTLMLYAYSLHSSVHMPRIGCGLAGGTWEKVCPMVEAELLGLNVWVYDFSDTSADSYVPPR